MTRRQLFEDVGLTLAAQGLLRPAIVPEAPTLPGTQPLTWEGDLSEKMMDGAHR